MTVSNSTVQMRPHSNLRRRTPDCNVSWTVSLNNQENLQLIDCQSVVGLPIEGDHLLKAPELKLRDPDSQLRDTLLARLLGLAMLFAHQDCDLRWSCNFVSEMHHGHPANPMS